MSETVDRIINDHLKQRPGARHAYSHDATMHNEIERVRNMLAVVEAAMQREGIPYDSAERVLNEAVRAGLEGWERDKLSRERALLLTTFDPSEFGRLPGPVFTEPSPDAAELTDDVSPERMTAWLDKEQERLRKATGFDLRDVLPVRPDEEPT